MSDRPRVAALVTVGAVSLLALSALPARAVAPAVAPAGATTCSEATGGSTDTLIHADNTSTTGNGFNCGYVASNGDDSIAMWDTEIVEHITGLGYQKAYDCTYDSGGVDISSIVVDGQGTAPTSMTWTAINSEDGTRHWTGAALFNTTVHSRYPASSQYLQNCDGSTIPFVKYHQGWMDWSYATAWDGSFPANVNNMVQVTLEPVDGYIYTDTDHSNKVALFMGTGASTDTAVGYGYFDNNVATFYVKLPAKAPGTVSLYPKWAGTDYTTATPPTDAMTGLDGSCLDPSGCSSNIIQTVTVNPTPGMPTAMSLSVNNAAAAYVGGSVKATVSATFGNGTSPGDWETGQNVYIKSMSGSTADPANDPTVATVALGDVNPTTQHPVQTIIEQVAFTSPSTAGSYNYYAYYPGVAPATDAPGYLPSSSTAVPVKIAAASDSCGSQYGALANTYIKANNSNTDATGYNCAYLQTQSATAGTKSTTSIQFKAPWPFKHVAVGNGSGGTNPSYCSYPGAQAPNGLVTVTTTAINGTSSSSQSLASWSFMNSSSSTSTAVSGAALWMIQTNSTDPYTGQFKLGCNVSPGTVKANLLYKTAATLDFAGSAAVGQASTFQVTTGPAYTTDTVTVNNAAVSVKQMLGSTPASSDPVVGTGTVTSNASSVSVTPVSGQLAFYADVDGSNYVTPTLPSTGWTAARTPTINLTPATSSAATTASAATVGSASTTRTRAVNKPGGRGELSNAWGADRTVRTAADVAKAMRATQVYAVDEVGTGSLTASCPVGMAIQSMHAASSEVQYGPADFAPAADGTGVVLNARGSSPTRLQVACRAITASAVVDGRLGRGSVRDDRLTSKVNGSVITGGLGADTMVVLHTGSLVDGGLGDDRLDVRASGSAGAGGPGSDTLVASAGNVLLNGGLGVDHFVTGAGVVRVNARDGMPGDIVTCGSAQSKVLVDAGDELRGPCTVVTPIG